MDETERTDDAAPDRGGTPPPPDPPTAPTEVLDGGDRPKRLLRSRSDRMLAGVSGGLGSYFSVDPVIFRIAFAVSVFFGGLGAIAYIALALFVPSEPETEGDPVIAPFQRSRWLTVAAGVIVVGLAITAAGSLLFWGDWGWDGAPWGLLILVGIAAGAYALIRQRDPDQPMGAGRTIAAIALAAVAAIVLLGVAGVSAFATATGGGVVVAGLVIVTGALLVVAAFRGGARWLIAPALALAIPLGVVSAADISFAGGVGERYHKPSSIAQVEDRYEHGVGRLVVDLREVDWRRETELPLAIDLGVGEAVVIVPEQVCVSPDAHIGAGEIVLGTGVEDGVDIDAEPSGAAPRGPSLALTADLDVGSLRVLNENDSVPYEPGPGGGFGNRGDFERDSLDRAAVC